MAVIKAPFDCTGSLMHYPERHREASEWDFHDAHWRVVEPFFAVMVLKEMRRARSAAYFVWHEASKPNVTYPMFMKDMFELAQKAIILRGTTRGVWKVQKRGTNYGIAYGIVLDKEA